MKQQTILAACIAIATATSLAPPAAIGASALDAAAPSPALAYRSTFDGYRPFADLEPKSWRAVNDTVRDVGGHAGVLKAAGDAAAKTAPAEAKASSGATSRVQPAPATR